MNGIYRCVEMYIFIHIHLGLFSLMQSQGVSDARGRVELSVIGKGKLKTKLQRKQKEEAERIAAEILKQRNREERIRQRTLQLQNAEAERIRLQNAEAERIRLEENAGSKKRPALPVDIEDHPSTAVIKGNPDDDPIEASFDIDPSTTLPGQQIPGQQIPGQQMPGQQMPGQQIPGQQIPGQQMPGQQMPGQDLSGQQMSAGISSISETPEMDLPLETMTGRNGDDNTTSGNFEQGSTEMADADDAGKVDEVQQKVEDLQQQLNEMQQQREQEEQRRNQIEIDDQHQVEMNAIENQHVRDIAELKQQQQEKLAEVASNNEAQVKTLTEEMEALRQDMITTQQESAHHQKFTTIDQQAEQAAKIEGMEQQAKISQAHHDKVMQQMAQLRTLNLEMQRDKEMNAMNWTTEERKEAEDREEALKDQIRNLEDQERQRIDKVMFDDAVEQKLLNDPRFSSPSTMSAREQAEFQTEKTLMKAGIAPDQTGGSFRPFAPGQSGTSQSATTTLPEAIKFFQAIHEMLLKDLKAVRKMNEEQVEEAKERIEEEHKK
jgi:hypothetical protein